jgi:hypothetical protein
LLKGCLKIGVTTNHRGSNATAAMLIVADARYGGEAAVVM